MCAGGPSRRRDRLSHPPTSARPAAEAPSRQDCAAHPHQAAAALPSPGKKKEEEEREKREEEEEQ